MIPGYDCISELMMRHQLDDQGLSDLCTELHPDQP